MRLTSVQGVKDEHKSFKLFESTTDDINGGNNMAKTKSNGPDLMMTSDAYNHMAPKWHLIETLLGGTVAMRAAGELYLPRYEEESTKRWEARMNMTSLLNLTKFTLSNLTGRVFKNPLVVKEDTPQQIKDLLPNINGQGDNLHVVSHRWFKEGLGKGISHILVDMPAKKARADGMPQTKEDDAKRKPYWVSIAPENVLYAYSETVGGVEKLLQVHILEEVKILQNYQEICTYQVKVLKPGVWEIWKYREKKVGSRTEKEWYKANEGEMGIKDQDGQPYIPLITFYAERKGLMLSEIPLEDLAHLNVEHWQSKTDQRNILTAARFPMLAVSGATGEDEVTGKKVTIGPYTLLATPDAQGKFYYVEHSGNAIASGRQDLRDLEDQMASYGAQFLKKKADNESATARILDSAETISELQSIALNFVDAVNQALQVTADWLNIKGSGGSVSLDSGLSLSMDGADTTALMDARRNGDLSRKQYLTELQRRDVLSDDFDQEENLAELEEENDVGLPMANDKTGV